MVAKCYRTIVCPDCDICALWPNGWMDLDATWYGGRPPPWPRPHCVKIDGTQTFPKRRTAHVCCSQTAGWIKMPLGMEVGLGPGYVVLDGYPAPTKKGHMTDPPLFGPRLLWPNGWVDQDATWQRGRPRPRPHCVRWDPAPPPKRGHSFPLFSAHVYCGQTAGWIKMPLRNGMEVGLSPGDIVLRMRTQLPSRKGVQQLPHFTAHFALAQ